MGFDVYKLLGLAQLACAIFAIIFLFNATIARNGATFVVGLFLLIGVFFSIDYCDWWPLIAAVVAAYLVRATGPQTQCK